MAYVKKIEAPLSVRAVHENVSEALSKGPGTNSFYFDLSRPQGRTRKVTLFNMSTGEPTAIVDYRVRTARHKKKAAKRTKK